MLYTIADVYADISNLVLRVVCDYCQTCLTSLISPSKTYSHKFTNPGEFSYFCRLHPTMVGEIEVTP